MVIGVIDLGAYTDTYWTGGDPRPKWAMEKRFLKTYADLYRPSPQASTQLLRCCKVLYQEAFPILYGDNTFYFDWFFFWARSWRKQLNFSRILPAIRHIYVGNSIWLHQPTVDEVQEMLKAMPNLRTYGMVGTHYNHLQENDKELVHRVKIIVRQNGDIFRGIAATSRDVEVGLVTIPDQPGKTWAPYVNCLT